jgi:signal transduction histidine kinase
MKIRSTIIVSIAAIVALISLSSTLGLYLVLETEDKFQQIVRDLPPSNQTASLNGLSIGEAAVLSLFDSSQTQLRVILLDAADETLADAPATAPALIILMVSAAGVIVIGVFLSFKISKPFQKLLLISKALARGKYDEVDPDVFSQTKSGRIGGMGQGQAEIGRAIRSMGKDELSQLYVALGEINRRLLEQQKELQQANEMLSNKNLELAESNKKLQALDKMKTDFINIAAHEIKNPIQPLLGCAALVKRGVISYDEAWKLVESQTKILKQLTDSILDVSRIENGVFTYSMKPMKINPLIHEVVSSSRVLSSDVKIEIELVPDQQSTILGDDKRLTQVLSNLIGNSLKFTKSGMIRVTSRIDGDKLELKVSDTGPGISADILPIIFNKFVTKSGNDGSGTGLGLFIVKSIVEAHKGSIRAENNPNGVGATFIMTIPTVREPEVRVHNESANSGSEHVATA